MRKRAALVIVGLGLLLGVSVSPAEETQTHTVYMPLVMSHSQPHKGVAMSSAPVSDIDLLEADWYYNWGIGSQTGIDDRYIPMSRCGDVPVMPVDTPYLLVFNEPNNREPYGCPIHMGGQAAEKVRAIEAAYPDTYLIVGNVAYYSYNQYMIPEYGKAWLQDFLNYYGDYDMALGVHSYDHWSPYYYTDHLRQWNDYFTLGDYDFWLTETNIIQAVNTAEFQLLIDGAYDMFTRFAIYSNRDYSGWITHADLVHTDGTLSDYGKIFRDR